MDPNVFRKGDAPSCLVVDKTWADVINKPDFLDELERRIVAMADGAEQIDLIDKSTTLREFKEAINTVLLKPLQMEIAPEEPEEGGAHGAGTILADAFWDEIKIPDDTWENFRDALVKAYNMKLRIQEHQPLSASDTLQTAKDNFTDTVVKPLLGINEDE